MSTEDKTKQLAEEIAGTLFVNGFGEHADRLVLRAGYPGPERDLGGWSVKGAVEAIEKCLRGAGEIAELSGGKAMTNDDRDCFARHASSEAIEGRLVEAERKKRLVDSEIVWLRELFAKRATQKLRGEWPSKAVLWLAILGLASLVRCVAWNGLPPEERAVILQQTIKSGVAALAHQALTEEACVTQPPTLWPRAPFDPTYRPEARQGLMASGIEPPDGPGMLRVGVNGCLEMLTLVPGDPGNAWVPYTGNASQLTQANYYARYGWGFWAGHSHGVDSEVCGPVQWYLELEGRHLNCGDQAVIDTWYSRPLFFGLWARYKALHPEPPPTPAEPPVLPPPAATPPPVLPPTCPPEKPCAPPVVCEVCQECPSPPAPAVLVIPPGVLETLRKAPGTVTIPRGKNGPTARAWQKKLEEARAWAESANGKPVSP